VERLEENDEMNELRRRHAEWFLGVARMAHAGLRSIEQQQWLERVRADTDNFRAVLAWTLNEDIAEGVELARTLRRPWHMRGQLPELNRWYELALASSDALDQKSRARGLESYGQALIHCERYESAERALEESLAIFRGLHDDTGVASALNYLSTVYQARGDSDRAISLLRDALATYEGTGDREGFAASLHLLGEALRDVGERDQARAMLENAASIAMRELGNADAAMTSLHSLGDLELDAGDTKEAAARFRDALRISSDLGDERSQAYCIAGLACVAALGADPVLAGRLWAVTESIEERLQLRLLAHERSRYERILATVSDSDGYRAGNDAGRGLTLDQVVREALDPST
jgi:tetratricopeptide (TPR) repeat protein